MTQRITRMISISRDNIIQFWRQPDFFTAVPGMASLKDLFNECNALFDKSAKDHGCRCRADVNVLAPGMHAFIDALNISKESDQEMMKHFIQFVAKTPDIETTGVTIYYSPTNGAAPQRYSYP